MAAQEVIGRSNDEGCSVMPNLSEAAGRMLAESGASGVHLAGNVFLKEGMAQGGCGIVCRHVREPATGIQHLHRKLQEGFDQIGKERIADAAQERDRRTTIEELAAGADRFLSNLQIRLTAKERDIFFALIARTDVVGGVRILTYSEIGERLGITKQAVYNRCKRMKSKHPQVWDYVQCNRSPVKPMNFSEMSPSQRRQSGVDESYGHRTKG